MNWAVRFAISIVSKMSVHYNLNFMTANKIDIEIIHGPVMNKPTDCRISIQR